MSSERKNEYLISTFGDTMLDRGFTSIPNTLIYYRKRLGLTASEFEFIIAIISLNWKEEKAIRDKEISPSSRDYCRQRQSLLAKGYLTFYTRNIYHNNKFCGTGTVYNLSGLKKAIETLVEQDRAIKNMDAPVEYKYDEPSLFGEDVKTEPLQPNKLIKENHNNDDTLDKEQEEFLNKYNKVHKELIGFEVRKDRHKRYIKYLLDIFSNRTHNNIDDALSIAKFYFFKLSLSKRDSLKLQDLLKMALTIKEEKKENTIRYSSQNNNSESNKNTSNTHKNELIPKGLDTLNYLLNILEKGGDIDEAYLSIANCS